MNRDRFIDGYLAAYNAKDFESLEGFYTDDVIFENYGGGYRQGRATVLAFLKSIHAKVQSKMTPQLVLVDGGEIALLGEDEITARIDVPDLPAGAMNAGDVVIVRIFALYTTQDNMISHVRFAGWPPVARAAREES